jgi:hypothetical protein
MVHLAKSGFNSKELFDFMLKKYDETDAKKKDRKNTYLYTFYSIFVTATNTKGLGDLVREMPAFLDFLHEMVKRPKSRWFNHYKGLLRMFLACDTVFLFGEASMTELLYNVTTSIKDADIQPDTLDFEIKLLRAIVPHARKC